MIGLGEARIPREFPGVSFDVLEIDRLKQVELSNVEVQFGAWPLDNVQGGPWDTLILDLGEHGGFFKLEPRVRWIEENFTSVIAWMWSHAGVLRWRQSS